MYFIWNSQKINKITIPKHIIYKYKILNKLKVKKLNKWIKLWGKGCRDRDQGPITISNGTLPMMGELPLNHWKGIGSLTHGDLRDIPFLNYNRSPRMNFLCLNLAIYLLKSINMYTYWHLFNCQKSKFHVIVLYILCKFNVD